MGNSHLARRGFLQSAGLILISSLPVLYSQKLNAASVGFDASIERSRKERIEGYRRTLRAIKNSGQLPIIDVEHHWGTGKGVPAFSVNNLISRMDQNGVALTWLGVNESMGNEASISESNQFPERLVPTIMHGDGPRWHAQDQSLLVEIDTEVRTGKYFAMGEFEARHYISSTNNRDIHTPLYSNNFEVIFRASSDTGIPFLLHHEAEDKLLPELEQMLVKYPNAKVIWCHVGRNRNPTTWTSFPTPDGVRRFLAKYPNLYFDILQSGRMSKFPPRNLFGGVYDAVMYDQEGDADNLRPEWLKLFNEIPNRFVIGSDINSGRWSQYDEKFERFRKAILNKLSPKSAELIAYLNAWQLMTSETLV